MLAYVAGWATGALFLAIERRHPGVRFHAAQAVVVFGGLSGLMAVSYGAALAGAFHSGTAFRVLLAVDQPDLAHRRRAVGVAAAEGRARGGLARARYQHGWSIGWPRSAEPRRSRTRHGPRTLRAAGRT